jgi:hypothetical protein
VSGAFASPGTSGIFTHLKSDSAPESFSPATLHRNFNGNDKNRETP